MKSLESEKKRYSNSFDVKKVEEEKLKLKMEKEKHYERCFV